jgi:hypothetical protein
MGGPASPTAALSQDLSNRRHNLSCEESPGSLKIWTGSPPRTNHEHAYAKGSPGVVETVLTAQPLHDGIGNFMCLLHNLSQALGDRQFKSGPGIVPVI